MKERKKEKKYIYLRTFSFFMNIVRIDILYCYIVWPGRYTYKYCHFSIQHSLQIIPILNKIWANFMLAEHGIRVIILVKTIEINHVNS